MLGSTAHRLAADQASTAAVAVLAPICVEKFLQNSDAQANLAALREISTNWQQGQYFEKGGLRGDLDDDPCSRRDHDAPSSRHTAISVLNSSLWTAVDKRSEAFVPRLLISNKS